MVECLDEVITFADMVVSNEGNLSEFEENITVQVQELKSTKE